MGLCVMLPHNTYCGTRRKGYGATPSRGCHKESLPAGHMNTCCPSGGASIWVKDGEDRDVRSTVLCTVYDACERTGLERSTLHLDLQ